MESRLFLVFLRRPRPHGDGRTDPFWEYGSFGLTGCHGRNLLHPETSPIRNGDRLAFVQGGDKGLRLLLVTPPVTREIHRAADGAPRMEVHWDAAQQPFRYGEKAPFLGGPSATPPEAFPELAAFLIATAPHRPTYGGKLASCFRARKKPLEPALAEEIETQFTKALQNATPGDFITHYTDALPRIDPAAVQQDRRARYEVLRFGEVDFKKPSPAFTAAGSARPLSHR